MTNEHELLTIAEAADLVRAPVATLRYWRHLGTGPRSFRIGRRVVYRLDDVEDWITAQRDATASNALAERHALGAPGRRGNSNV